MISIKETMKRLEPYGPKRQPTINHYCNDGLIPAENRDGRWFVDENYIENAIGWRKGIRTTEEMLEELPEFHQMNETSKPMCIRKVSEKTARYLSEDAQYGLLFAGRLIAPEHERIASKLVETVVGMYMDRATMFSVAEAAEQMGLSVYKLKKLINQGAVDAKQVGQDWYLQEAAIEIFNNGKDCMIGLYDISVELVSDMQTLFDPERMDHRYQLAEFIRRSKLLPFMISWKESGLHGDRRNAYYFPKDSKDQLIELLVPFFRHYGFADDRLEQYLSHDYWKCNPETFSALKKYAGKKKSNAVSVLAEAIVMNLECEIMDADSDRIDEMVDYCIDSPLDIYEKEMCSFLKWVKSQYEVNYIGSYDYKSLKTKKRNTNNRPYTTEEYLLMGFMTFADEHIKKLKLVEKALEDPKMAFLWMYTIMHFITMWRQEDIKSKIPVIHLKMSRGELKRRIISGEFTDKDADALSLRLEYAVEQLRKSPDKTHKGLLRLHCQESLRPIIGLAYACCLIHAEGEFIEGVALSAGNFRFFFGEKYFEIFGHHTFKNRRANKAYADELVEITELNNGKEHKVLGYMVASYARSHVMRDGKISGVTHHYLSHKLDGISDNQVIVKLLDLGPCSFIIEMFLETIYGEKYKALPFEEQAAIVKQTGLSPNDVEMFSRAILDARAVARQTVRAMIESYPTAEGQRSVCMEALSNIVEGYASSKTYGVNCLSLALKKPCGRPSCEHCLGCPSALLTKSALFTVMDIIRDAAEKMHAAKTEATRQTQEHLISTKYIPALATILKFCKEKYGMDVREYTTEAKALLLGEETNV